MKALLELFKVQKKNWMKNIETQQRSGSGLVEALKTSKTRWKITSFKHRAGKAVAWCCSYRCLLVCRLKFMAWLTAAHHYLPTYLFSTSYLLSHYRLIYFDIPLYSFLFFLVSNDAINVSSLLTTTTDVFQLFTSINKFFDRVLMI